MKCVAVNRSPDTPVQFPGVETMIDPVAVLSQEEMTFASQRAIELHKEARARGVPDAHGARPGDITPDDEIGAAQAEFAASRIFGVKWSAGERNARKDGPDIGRRTQVRRVIKLSSKSLIIRPWDLQKYGDVPFLLMRQEGNVFAARGWIMACEAGRVCQLTDKGTGRPPAWFVRESQLHPIEHLKDV
jgi:hypothetical protein